MELDATIGPDGPDAPRDLPPRVGRFQIQRELGRGAMGVVFLAHDPVLDREVALKVLKASEDTTLALLREAQTMARLAHPNIVAVHDVGQHEGRTFVAMERVIGGTLRTWLGQRARHTAEILDAFAQAGEGLSAAHQAGLIHCDFKPDNVLVGDDGRVRVGDFGLATGSGSSAIVGTGPARRTGIFGTPAYMSPEQAGGALLDARTDQFSFCVALFEALHGVPPFAGDTLSSRLAAMTAREFAPLSPVPGLSDEVTATLLRGLALAPVDRFANMEALLLALRAARRRGGLVVPPAERVSALWSAGARDAIRGRFESVGLPFVSRTFNAVADALEQHLDRWVAAAEQAQTMVAEDPFWYADSLAHSERAFQEFSVYVGVLEHGDPIAFASAFRGTLPLRPLGEYVLPEAVPAASPRPPRDPTRRRAAEQVRSQSIRAAMLSSLRSPDALVLAQDAVSSAEHLGDGPTLSEALLVAGAATVLSGQSQDVGIGLLERAHALALEVGDTLFSALTAIDLARSTIGLAAGVPTSLKDTGRVPSLLRAAHAALRRLGSPLKPTADLAVVEGAFLLRTGDHAAARETFTRALAQIENGCGADSPDRVPLLIRRAMAFTEASDMPSAVTDVEAALSVLTNVLGEDHPGLAQTIDFQGHILMLAGRLDAAAAAYDRLATVLDGAPQPDVVRRAWCDHKRGEIAMWSGDVPSAAAWFERSLARYRARGPVLHWNAIVGPMDHLALAYWLLGDLQRARSYAEETWLASQSMSPPPQLARLVRAVSFADDGAFAEAHAALDDVQAQHEMIPGGGWGLTICVDVWRARVACRAGRFEEAIEMLDRVLVGVSPGGDRAHLEVLADRALAHVAAGHAGAQTALEDVLSRAEHAGLSAMPYLDRVRAHDCRCDLSDLEVDTALAEASGDLALAAQKLGVSLRSLQLRRPRR